MYKLLFPLIFLFTACSGAQKADSVTAAAAGDSFKDGVSYYNKQISINKNNSAAYYKLAALYLENGQLEAADKNIKEALTLNPDKADYHFIKARLDYLKGSYLTSSKNLQNYFSLKTASIETTQQQEERLCQDLYKNNCTLEDCGFKYDGNNVLETYFPSVKQKTGYFIPYLGKN